LQFFIYNFKYVVILDPLLTGQVTRCMRSELLASNLGKCKFNALYHKMGHNSACVKIFCEIFAPIGGFSGKGYRMLPIAFFPNRFPLLWQRNSWQIGL